MKVREQKPTGRKWNQLIDAVVTILKCKISIIYHAIYIKVLSDEKVSYILFSTEYVINNTNDETESEKLSKKLLSLNFEKDLYLNT